jgi:hypothetical protein
MKIFSEVIDLSLEYENHYTLDHQGRMVIMMIDPITTLQ